MIEKNKIAASFSRSATTYDSVAYLQRDVGNRLLKNIDDADVNNADIKQCLDLGCGTGFFQEALHTRFSQANHIACDLSEGMLQYVKTHRAVSVSCVGADAEKLPFANDSIDLIYSNLALQWCEYLDTAFAEAHRALAKNGYFCLTTLGPKTLYELKAAWSCVDEYEHVNQFQNFSQWSEAFTKQGFKIIHSHQQYKVLQFESLKQLSQELKQLGAHNMNAGQSRSLMGKQRWQCLQTAYDAYRMTNGYYPATYEVYYIILKK